MELANYALNDMMIAGGAPVLEEDLEQDEEIEQDRDEDREDREDQQERDEPMPQESPGLDQVRGQPLATPINSLQQNNLAQRQQLRNFVLAREPLSARRVQVPKPKRRPEPVEHPTAMALQNWEQQNPLFVNLLRHAIACSPGLPPLSVATFLEIGIRQAGQTVCAAKGCCQCPDQQGIITLAGDQPVKVCMSHLAALPAMEND